MRNEAIVEQFRKLSTDEKLDLLRTLWSEFEAEEASRPLSDEERRFLDDRLRDIDEDPRPDRSWEEVRAELLHER